jgi:hypothetical protein
MAMASGKRAQNHSIRTGALMVAGLALVAGSASAVPIQVIYSKKTGHPTATIPGAVNFAGAPEAAEWRGIENLAVSPDGSRWLLLGRSNQSDHRDTLVMLGQGAAGSVLNVGGHVFQEGQPAVTAGGGDSGWIEFFPSGFGRFNSANNFVLGIRARTTQDYVSSATSATDGQRAVVWNGTNLNVAFKQLDPYSGMMDTTTSGDETVGNSVGSFHLLDDGRIGTQDATINNINSARRPAITYDRAMFKQINVSTVNGFGGVGTNTLTALTTNTFFTTPNGAHWFTGGAINPSGTALPVLVYDNTIVLQAGQPVSPGGPIMGDSLHTFMANNGRWISRGRDNSGTTAAAPDWVVRENVLVAKTGDSITPGSTEHWGDTIAAITINSSGDYVVIGNTDNAEIGKNEVAVLNGTTVIFREGDPIDLDGNGMFDDSAFIGRGNNTLTSITASVNNGQVAWWLTDSKVLYGLINLRDGELSGNDINITPAFSSPTAFIRMNLATCRADFDGNGSRTIDDIFIFLNAWFAMDPRTDVDGIGGVNIDDIFIFINIWFAGCP